MSRRGFLTAGVGEWLGSGTPLDSQAFNSSSGYVIWGGRPAPRDGIITRVQRYFTATRTATFLSISPTNVVRFVDSVGPSSFVGSGNIVEHTVSINVLAGDFLGFWQNTPTFTYYNAMTGYNAYIHANNETKPSAGNTRSIDTTRTNQAPPIRGFYS